MPETEFNYNIPKNLTIKHDNKWLKHVHPLWSRCNTFSKLLENMALFVNGELPNTPTHMGYLEDTNPEYITRLVHLNNIGVLTDNGQEFVYDVTTKYINMQREYLVFAYEIKPNQSLDSIIQKFDNSDLFYYAINYADKKVYQSSYLGYIGFNNPEFWLTRDYLIESKTFENHTHVAEPKHLLNCFENFQYYTNNFYDGKIFFHVWSRTWNYNKTYLADIVIQCFE